MTLGFAAARPVQHAYRLRQARQALANRNPDEALVWLDAARRSDRIDATVYFLTARAHRQLEEYGTAMADLQQAHQLRYPTEELERERLLALAESAQIGLDDPRLGTLLANPGDDIREIYESLVKGYYRLYELGPAQLVLDSWEEDYPKDAQPKFYRGLVLEHDAKWPEAEMWYRRAITLNPDRSDFRLHLALVLRKQHHYREAIQHYRQCLQMKETASGFYGLGKCLQARGELPQARESFLKGLQIEPDDYDCLIAMGELEVDTGQGKEALRWLEPAASQRPHEYEVRYALARALLYAGEGDLARPHFQFAAQARSALSQVKALRQHVGEHPEDVGSRYRIGVALLEYGDVREGLKWLHSVFKYQAEHHDAHAALAKFYSEQGNDEAAAEHAAPAARTE
jgi:tetratricopeptide (TPR) repeat protein